MIVLDIVKIVGSYVELVKVVRLELVINYS